MKYAITIDRDGGDAMKKKICLLAIMSVSIMLLSACSSTKTLKEEDNAIIAQYIAGSVLKYDTYYTDGLVYAYQRPPADGTAAVDTVQTVKLSDKEDYTNKVIKADDTTKVENSTSNEEVKETYSKLSDIYKNKNLRVDYKKYTTTTSYTGDYSEQAFNVEAKPGNQLVILEFKMKNSSKNKQTINLIRSGITYELNVDEEVYYPILSIVSNDIQQFNSTIAAGKSKNAVLIFEVPKELKVNNTTLTVTNVDKVSLVTVK
ncbi:MAG: DUF4352 domain-containing protein [Clostridiales bacterium]|nr:DUF4352 domain-containing protein [Clostridiales bacterium]